MSSFQTIIYEKKGRVAEITLNRPDVLNAMNLQMHTELGEVWDDFEADDELWLAVLKGAGERSFSVGQDIKELATLSRHPDWTPSSYGSRGRPGWPRLTERFNLAKPIIARVQGFALGGGFELALACDIIVASEHAVFALPEARLGLVPGAGGVFRLVRQLPSRVAMGYLLTGRRIGAGRAFELGLANEVVPTEQLDLAVERWVADILECAPLSVRSIKEAALTSDGLPLEDAFQRQYHWEEHRLRSRDLLAGPQAFVEKRKPVWKGE